MLRRLVVPLDGSPLAEAILPQVEQLVADARPNILLLTVVDPDASPALSDDAPLKDGEALRYLEEKAAWLRARGATVHTRLCSGDPAAEIVRNVVQEGADAIAMSTHGRTGLERLLHGSVSEGVLRTSPVPVLLWRPQPWAP